jgi:hypothetical protein
LTRVSLRASTALAEARPIQEFLVGALRLPEQWFGDGHHLETTVRLTGLNGSRLRSVNGLSQTKFTHQIPVMKMNVVTEIAMVRVMIASRYFKLIY